MKSIAKGASRIARSTAFSSSSSLLSFTSTVILSLLFTLSGVGTALLGSALPAFLAHWSLKDRDGGLLFFMAWFGSALGALLSRGKPANSVARGVILVAVACFALIHAGRISAFPLIFCYGLGLGITMTSISLLRSQREEARRAQELNRLNLLWAIGAVASPTLAAHALFTSGIAYLFALLGFAFAFLGLWVVAVEPRLPSFSPRYVSHKGLPLSSLPLVLCAVSALMVGIEASLGGWLTTYVKRADHSVAGAVTATSAFWAGLLASRALNSTPLLLRFNAIYSLRSYVWLVTVTLCLLSLTHHPGTLLTLAFILGFGLGPLYPLLLALVLPRYRGNRVFFCAGLGSAVLPWLTGVLSSGAGSLRAGLAIPCAAGCLLVLLVGYVSPERHGITRS